MVYCVLCIVYYVLCGVVYCVLCTVYCVCGAADAAAGSGQDVPWYVSIFRSMFGDDSGSAGGGASPRGEKNTSASTKFTKLSMFKFRRELGRWGGALTDDECMSIGIGI